MEMGLRSINLQQTFAGAEQIADELAQAQTKVKETIDGNARTNMARCRCLFITQEVMRATKTGGRSGQKPAYTNFFQAGKPAVHMTVYEWL